MKTLKIFLVLLISTPLFAQIPNGSFETWVQQSSWEEPVDWTTNNAEMGFVSVSKYTSLSNGNYAMKVESRGKSFEGFAPGIASCTFLCSDNFNALELSYQIDSIVAGGHIEIVVSQYDGNEYIEIGYWKTESVSQGTEMLQLPLSTINNDSLKIEIRANSILTAVGYEGHAEIIVDKLSLQSTASTDSQPQGNNINIYPNPTTGTLNIESKKNFSSIKILDLTGKVFHEQRFANSVDLNSLASGTYIIELYSKEETYRKQIVKE